MSDVKDRHIWIGGKNERLLEIVARHADYVNFASCSVEEFKEKLDILRRQCLKVRRNFEDIEKTWHGRVIIVEKEGELRQEALKAKQSSTNKKVQKMELDKYLNEIIAGTPEQCVEKIQEYIDLGVKYFIPHFPFSKDLKPLRIFMEKIAPEFK